MEKVIIGHQEWKRSSLDIRNGKGHHWIPGIEKVIIGHQEWKRSPIGQQEWKRSSLDSRNGKGHQLDSRNGKGHHWTAGMEKVTTSKEPIPNVVEVAVSGKKWSKKIDAFLLRP